mgnify:CR=1 FL=1
MDVINDRDGQIKELQHFTTHSMSDNGLKEGLTRSEQSAVQHFHEHFSHECPQGGPNGDTDVLLKIIEYTFELAIVWAQTYGYQVLIYSVKAGRDTPAGQEN